MRPSVSVIVANRGRAWSLVQTLSALKRQREVSAEIIVVSDAPAPRDLTVKWLRQDAANIATARNAGIRASSGEIIAFCDDDAVPEPDWLLNLIDAFDAPDIGAVGGPVLGPDGVREQWGEMRFDEAGRDTPTGTFLKLNGTNLALRRRAITAIGGFDQRFAYYLDETDMLARLAKAGWMTTWIANARVHHATRPNTTRGAGTTLAGFEQLGRSVAAFVRTHAPQQQEDGSYVIADQRVRLRRLFNLGILSAQGFEARLSAIKLGLSAQTPQQIDTDLPQDFRAADPRQIAPLRVAIAPRILSRSAARQLARELSLRGVEVTLITQTWLNRPMRVKFHTEGYFDHRGGVFRTKNMAPNWRAMLMQELVRIQPQRQFTHLVLGKRRGGAVITDLRNRTDGVILPHMRDKNWRSVLFEAESALDALQH